MKQFIIYGVGSCGRKCFEFLEWKGIEDIYISAFCDKKYNKIREVYSRRCISYSEAISLNIPFLIALVDEKSGNEVLHMIESDGGEGYLYSDFYKILGWEQHVYYREYCAFIHAKYNDKWFDDAEQKEAVDIFWSDNSKFYQHFKRLDLSNVIELACGHGRHVPYYIDSAEKVTLVDILEENMEICKERFKDYDKIEYYQNNGYNLERLPDDNYTALFTYDSMVHFELMDIYEYLKDIYRVLLEGGYALFHHSNYASDYKTNFTNSPHARCFMSKDIFAYLAYRTGFKVVDQSVIDWYGTKGLDCITLLKK